MNSDGRDGPRRIHSPSRSSSSSEEEDGRLEELDSSRLHRGGHDLGCGQVRHHAPCSDPCTGPPNSRSALVVPVDDFRARKGNRSQSGGGVLNLVVFRFKFWNFFWLLICSDFVLISISRRLLPQRRYAVQNNWAFFFLLILVVVGFTVFCSLGRSFSILYLDLFASHYLFLCSNQWKKNKRSRKAFSIVKIIFFRLTKKKKTTPLISSHLYVHQTYY